MVSLFNTDANAFNQLFETAPEAKFSCRVGYYTSKPLMDLVGSTRSTGAKALGIVMIYLLTFVRSWHNPEQTNQDAKIINRAKAGIAATIGSSSCIDGATYGIAVMIQHYHALWTQFHIGDRLKIMNTILSVGAETFPINEEIGA